jgi:hypothetical protein
MSMMSSDRRVRWNRVAAALVAAAVATSCGGSDQATEPTSTTTEDRAKGDLVRVTTEDAWFTISETPILSVQPVGDEICVADGEVVELPEGPFCVAVQSDLDDKIALRLVYGGSLAPTTVYGDADADQSRSTFVLLYSPGGGERARFTLESSGQSWTGESEMLPGGFLLAVVPDGLDLRQVAIDGTDSFECTNPQSDRLWPDVMFISECAS